MVSKIQSQTFEFSALSKWLHWGTMFLLIVLMVAGTMMVGLADSAPQKAVFYRLHGIVGLLIVLITLTRIVIRLRHPQPTPERMTEKWNIWLHGIVQWGLYLVLLGIGISGLSTLTLNNTNPFTVDPATLVRSVVTIPGHFLLTRLLLVLVVLHVAGVLRHQFTRSDVLRRMGLSLQRGKDRATR